MDNPKTEVIKSIKDAQNVLVTVRKNPSVDELAAAIGMTLVLNKLGKHGTAVFSGSVPSTIEFLKPQDTLEKTTDSLRDFIISLDKAKADKLRYKVEDEHVKIFITPYRTKIGEEDLIFSQGDFNVDVVLALGVHEQSDLDQAITAHGRILHDAKIVSVNVYHAGELGGINLNEQGASSLSEVMAEMSLKIKEDVFDEQIATALLTGIVAETDRFSNEKTKPETMTISAKLMAAGANQQLVATQLQVKEQEPEAQPSDDGVTDTDSGDVKESEDSVKHSDGSLEIKHTEPPKQDNNDSADRHPHEVHVDDDGNFKSSHIDELPPLNTDTPKEATAEPEPHAKRKELVLQPPSSAGTLNAANKDGLEGTSDPLSQKDAHQGPILSHNKEKSVNPNGADTEQVDQAETPIEDQTLDSLEKAVDSPHQQAASKVPPAQPQPATEVQPPQAPDLPEPAQPTDQPDDSPDLNELQSAVDKALESTDNQKPLEPIAALNANPVDLDLSHDQATDSQEDEQPANEDQYLDVTKLDEQSGEPAPPTDEKPKFPPDPKPGPTTDAAGPASPPPPVPPPMMPPSGDDDLSLPPVAQ